MTEKTIELSGSETPTGQIHVKLDMILPHKQAMSVLEIVRDHQLAEKRATEAAARKEEAERRKVEAAARKAAKTEAAKAKRGKGTAAETEKAGSAG